MMHGYGFDPVGRWMHPANSFFGGTEWMVIPVMGFGFLLLFGLIAWVIWSQRHALGLGGPGAGTQAFGAASRDFGIPRQPMHAETAEQIAARRYATGEIDVDEYLGIVRALSGDG